MDRFNSPLRELLVYMRHLRRRGRETDNRILTRLAQPQRVENLVGFLVQRTGVSHEVDTIVVGDLHLGSKHSMAEALHEALKAFSFNRLVLNGDIFDRPELGAESLRAGHHALLEYLRELSQTREVVWIRGNHDHELAQFLHDTKVHHEFEWEYRGTRYLALHGDQFDYFSKNHPALYWIGTELYIFIQRLGPWTKNLCSLLKRKTKWYTNAMASSIKGALAHGRARGAQVVLCGHTHQVEQISGGGVSYYNPGGWTEHTGHLITIGELGVQIHAFNPDGRHLGVRSPIAV